MDRKPAQFIEQPHLQRIGQPGNRIAAPIVVATGILLAGLLRAPFADIKVGSYVWQHKYDGRTSYGVPTANMYGGGYGHLDISWTWTLEDGMARVNNDWTTAATCLDDNPTWYAGHTGMQSANYLLKKMFPATWTRIKAHSDAGRYDGSELSWSEGYFSFGGDEYYLRNYYIGYHFCLDNFGYAPLIAAGYDLDAPCWTQPKIQTYITGRSTENPAGLGFYNHFTWNWNQPDMAKPNGWNQWRWTSDDGSMVIVGTQGLWSGDGGGAEICAASAGRFPAFASKVFKENVWTTSVPNLWNDNIIASGSGFSLFFWGAKMCENRLLEAEKFATFARQFGYTYPLNGDKYLYDVWGGFIKFNQHDLADAQGTPWQTVVSNTTNMNLQDAYTSALKLADSTLTTALSAISSNVNTTGNGTPVIVYNALSWPRTDYVIVTTSDIGFSSPVHVEDAGGAVVPSQVINDRGVSKLVFTADSVPSMGFREYRVVNTAAPVAAGVTASTQASGIVLDNQYITVKVNRTSGAIDSLYDKVNAKQIMGGPGNRIASTTASPNWWENCCIQSGHHPNPMPATLTTFRTPSSVTLVDSGPAMARIKATYVENTVSWEHDIILYAGVPVACNLMSTSNLNSNNELVLNIPLGADVSNTAKELNAGVAYGHHKYVNGNPYAGGMEPPTHKWANVANDAKNYSVALLENNCTIWSFYGVGGAHDLRLVLIAEETSNWQGHWSKTDWEMSWGIWGHAGDWTDGAVQKGYEFNSPLIPRVVATHSGQLPSQYSFLTVEPENILVTAVKKWESESPTRNDSLTMQVRFYEIDGKNTDAVLRFASSPIAAWESMGNEYGVYGGQLPVTSDGGMQKVTFTTGHNQIRSLKVQMPYGGSAARWDAGPAVRVRGMTAAAPSLIYNARGQVVRRVSVAGSGRESISRALPAGGIYLLQYVDKDGRSVVTRRVCSPGR